MNHAHYPGKWVHLEKKEEEGRVEVLVSVGGEGDPASSVSLPHPTKSSFVDEWCGVWLSPHQCPSYFGRHWALPYISGKEATHCRISRYTNDVATSVFCWSAYFPCSSCYGLVRLANSHYKETCDRGLSFWWFLASRRALCSCTRSTCLSRSEIVRFGLPTGSMRGLRRFYLLRWVYSGWASHYVLSDKSGHITGIFEQCRQSYSAGSSSFSSAADMAS